jgi:hypothetical protein
MIIEILIPYEQWQPGNLVDAEINYANALIALQVARKHESQERIDLIPQKEKQQEPQKIEVNNFYGAPVNSKKPKINRTLK